MNIQDKETRLLVKLKSSRRTFDFEEQEEDFFVRDSKGSHKVALYIQIQII